MNEKESTCAQIIYHCSTSPESIPDIAIYIFTTGTYTIDGEINHNQCSTHNRGNS